MLVLQRTSVRHSEIYAMKHLVKLYAGPQCHLQLKEEGRFVANLAEVKAA